MKRIKKLLQKFRTGDAADKICSEYFARFKQYAFTDCKCKYYEQFEASIIRLYHTIEKGLSYSDFRPAFGKENVEKLIVSLEQYAKNGFDVSAFFYETALSCLHAYMEKNARYGYTDESLKKRIDHLPGKTNFCGGVTPISRPTGGEMTFEQLMLSRHSIRHFSDKPVDIEILNKSIEMAQHTPSACNRQGWSTRIITDKKTIAAILSNQNGNRGFGEEIDKLLIITSDLRAQQRGRETFQAFIDGGMYAESILNALYYNGIGSIPLSASLTVQQENNVRRIAEIDDAEVLILFIGVGNYPEEEFLTTRSERKKAVVKTIP